MDHRPPDPELSFDGRIDIQGVSKVRAGARGTPAIVALQRVLIILGVVVALVAGAVAIVAVVMAARAQREDPQRQGLGRCTEHIERTEHTEYIERTCTRAGS
jgi:sugar phosphate permease